MELGVELELENHYSYLVFHPIPLLSYENHDIAAGMVLKSKVSVTALTGGIKVC